MISNKQQILNSIPNKLFDSQFTKDAWSNEG